MPQSHRLTVTTKANTSKKKTATTGKPARPFQEVSPIDERILQAVYTYHFLTSEQIVRLLYSKGSLTYAQTLLKHLVEKGFLLRLYLPRATRAGSLPNIYTLAGKGIAHLRRLGMEVENKFRPSEQKEHSYLFLYHTLAVNDFLISASLLPREAPHISLADMRHERILRHDPQHITTKEGVRVAVIPDGWLDFHIETAEGKERGCILLELDRGTIEQKPFRRKIEALVAYSKGPYKAQFGTSSITIACATTKGEKRADDLRRWTEQELETLEEKREADLFRFCALPEHYDPAALFLTPAWRPPFEINLLPLLQ